MRLKILLPLLLICSIANITAQEKFNFGVLSEAEKNFKEYKIDTTANAVVLYERGDNYFEVVGNQIRIIKEYHVKIKILNEKGFDQGMVTIPFYHNDETSEKIIRIKANTHNGKTVNSIFSDKFYINKVSENWSEMAFAFPNLKEGSILEYYYKLTSPFYFNFNGWDFQSSIPKLYSEFNAKIPAYYQYNRKLYGNLKLSTNEASIWKNCFKVHGTTTIADCEILKYVMMHIPAFKLEEDYMLAASNYISHIDFELSQLQDLNGAVRKITKTWYTVDREFRTDKNIGRQLKRKNYFEKNVPESLLNEGTELERAINIYKFIQNHYTWNTKFGIFGKARVKEAFEKKAGNVAEINMSLINLLNAAGIETKLMLSSTRQQGLPKTSHPVMSDFNYFLAQTKIGGTTYLLDATDKFFPFGMLPFRALNHYGRVLNFKEESFWGNITTNEVNRNQIRGQLKFDSKENKFFGVLDFLNIGYSAVNKRKEIEKKNQEEYIDELQELMEDEINITSYKLNEKVSDEKKVFERIHFSMENFNEGEIIYLNPFIVKFFDQNPFRLERRNYPIDFGYPRSYNYQMTIEVPPGYVIQEFAKNKVVTLGDDAGSLKLYMSRESNLIKILYNFVLKESHFTADNYDALKEIFNQSIEVQKNSLIVLKKE